MKTDRELLEAAATSYWGEEVDDVCSIRWLEADQAIGYTHGDNQDHNGQDREFVWNPLTEDGDALRLAVKLGLEVGHNSFGNVIVDHYTQRKIVLPHGDDRYAATRRAIVRAAAAMVER